MDTRTGRNGTRSKVTGNFLVNATHAFHRFNRRYHVKRVNQVHGISSSVFKVFFLKVLSLRRLEKDTLSQQLQEWKIPRHKIQCVKTRGVTPANRTKYLISVKAGLWVCYRPLNYGSYLMAEWLCELNSSKLYLRKLNSPDALQQEIHPSCPFVHMWGITHRIDCLPACLPD